MCQAETTEMPLVKQQQNVTNVSLSSYQIGCGLVLQLQL